MIEKIQYSMSYADILGCSIQPQDDIHHETEGQEKASWHFGVQMKCQSLVSQCSGFNICQISFLFQRGRMLKEGRERIPLYLSVTNIDELIEYIFIS
mgnify:CR=1 FL=1